MAGVETLEGKVASLETRPTAGGTVLEFELRSATDETRRVQALEDEAKPLRDGDLVAVVGGTDANGILVAQRIAILSSHRVVEADPTPSVEPTPSARVPRWLPYAFPASAVVAVLLFFLAAGTDLNRGDGLPVVWAALGTLSLVISGSGLAGPNTKYMVPAVLLRFTGKVTILIAFLAWWSGTVRDPEGRVEAGLWCIVLAGALVAYLDYRELTVALRTTRMPFGPVASRTRWGLLMVFPLIAIAALTSHGLASQTIAHESIAFSALWAGALLVLWPLLIRNRRKLPRLTAVKALMQFAGSVLMLLSLDFYYRVFLYAGAGVFLLFTLIILLWRTFYQRATSG